jgi:hypothetical protein
MSDTEWLPDEYVELHDRAVELLQQPALASAVSRLLSEDTLARELTEKPGSIADVLGLRVPDGLDVRVIGLDKPVPEWAPFTLRLTGCRRYWVRRKGKYEYEQVEICRGVEIVPNPIPGGPWG